LAIALAAFCSAVVPLLDSRRRPSLRHQLLPGPFFLRGRGIDIDPKRDETEQEVPKKKAITIVV